jgi:hypothetical protein
MVAMRVPGALLALLLLGCSASTDGSGPQPGEEMTTFGDPTPEATGAAGPTGTAEEPVADPGADAVAVELPGLPIGGGGAVFSEPNVPQCLDVNLTGDPLPAGVAVVIEEFAVPAPFSLSDDLCGDAPPCLGGHVLSSSGGGSCEVAVEWTGQEGASGSLGVRLARGSCEDPDACAAAADLVAAAAPQTLALTLQPSEPGPDPGTDSDTDTETGPETGPETEPETGPDPDPDTSIETEPETDPGGTSTEPGP